LKPCHWLVFVLLLAAVITVAVALRPLAEAAGERVAPPPSAADLLRERRQAAPQPAATSGWVTPAIVLAGACLLAFARSGAEFLKQWRLSRRPRRRTRPRPLPELPPLDELPPWPDS
jgi:hypothetical protein